jgi:C4-dicarboxylate transporter, DctM subunit
VDTVQIGLTAIAVLLGLLAIRVPIGVALTGVALVGIALIRGPSAALSAAGSLPHSFAASWHLASLPLFLLMGSVAYHSGLTSSLYAAARLWLGFLPGGLAVASNFACAGFSAASGSSVATAAAMGRLCIPEMLKYRYDPSLATGVVASAGTLGAMIPPSIAFILYGWFTETPVGELLIAGILPGLMTAMIYALLIVVRCHLNPELAPRLTETITWRQRLLILREIWPLPVLIMGVMGSIYAGIATATEAAGFGASLAFVIAVVQRRMTLEVFRRSLIEALETTGTLFFVAFGAIMLTRFFALAGVPTYLASFITEIGLDQLMIVLAASVIFIVLGMFLDPIGIMLLTLPIMSPILDAANINMIWFGVLVVKFLEVGLITPPVGMNVYVIKGVVGNTVPLTTIFRGVLWFLGAEAVVILLLISFPEISLFLPNLMN